MSTNTAEPAAADTDRKHAAVVYRDTFGDDGPSSRTYPDCVFRYNATDGDVMIYRATGGVIAAYPRGEWAWVEMVEVDQDGTATVTDRATAAVRG